MVSTDCWGHAGAVAIRDGEAASKTPCRDHGNSWNNWQHRNLSSKGSVRSVRYLEFVRNALDWGRILAVRCTACDHSCSWQGSWRYRTWRRSFFDFIWYLMLNWHLLHSLTMSTFSTSLKELWFGVLQGVVKTGLAIAIPEAQKAWGMSQLKWMPNRWNMPKVFGIE